MWYPGDYFVICDLSGQKALRSQCVRQWDGQIVRKEYAEHRHPLDFEKPPRPERIPRDSRPEPQEIFITQVTIDDL